MLPSCTGPSRDALLHIIRAEYREMPCLRLSASQFRRLWHLDDALCEHVTATLLAEGFLGQDQDRRFYWTKHARP